MPEFAQSDLNRLNRRSNRGHYDKTTIFAILDEALICHVGFVYDGQPPLDDPRLLPGLSAPEYAVHYRRPGA